jgi:replicative DNA helicase
MSGDSRNDNRVQEVSYISRNLKTLARELNVPVLAAAQLSRAVEQRTDKKPMLSDLRESGSLEQDADIVMFIHKVTDEIPERNVDPENEQQRELIELMVAKHRNGPTKDIQMMFIKNLAQFYDILPEHRYKK